ncbi:MAG TPA: diguanylate cyclase [Vicinamibacteria bacterium]|jgi:diguanylate cyclase (GGDEF)-like protein
MSATRTTQRRPGVAGRRSRGRLGRWGAATLVALATGAVPQAAAQSAPPGDAFDLAHPAIRAFSDREGLPQNSVHAVTRDPLGYVWVGTMDGAARWNGREWYSIDMPNRDVSNYVRSLLATRDCTLWFGREAGGVVRLRRDPLHPTPRPEDFTVFDEARGMPAARVNHVLETRDGSIWAATSGGGAARLVAERFEPVTEGLRDPRLWVLAELADDDGHDRLLAGGEGGLAVLNGSKWAPIDLGPPSLVGSVNSLLQTRDASGVRSLWVGSYGGGVLRLRDGRVERFGPAEGLASRLVTALTVTRGAAGEQIWAGTRDAGLFRLSDGRFSAVPLGPSISEIYSLRGGEDDPGALWVGTRTGGLLRLEAGSWASLDSSSGLPADQVLGLLETKDVQGRPVYWVGTANGLAVIRGARVDVEGAAHGLPGPQVLAVEEFRDRGQPSQIWASVVGMGLVRRVGERWQRVDARPAFGADHGSRLLATTTSDGTGVLWVGTERSGLARMEKGAWTALTQRDGLPSDYVLSLLETQTRGVRTLWVGTRGGGVAELVDGRVVRIWNRGSGLPNDDALALAEVRVGAQRELWVGTRAGVARRDLDADPPTWSRLGLAATPAGPAGTVFSIGQGGKQRIYLGTQRGVVRLTPAETAARGGDEFVIERFGVADGLPSATANWRQLVDSRGRVWIATTAGIALLDPEREASFAAPQAPLLIERAQSTRSGAPIASGAALAASERDVLFEYALLTTRRAGAVRYRTQLVGYDAEPSAWLAGYQKAYTNLPAADYVFRVEARDAGGLRSGPVELSFSVQPSRWLRPWALALESVTLAVVATLLLRARERALRRRARSLETLVTERTQQLQQANAQLAELSVTDPLTGLANRRALEAHAEGEWRRIARFGGSLAFVMVDVDHFKAYNDSRGHLAGDECLRRVADALRRLAQRPGDLVGRYGGEEFACLLVGVEREHTAAHAERLRAVVEDLALPHPASQVAPVVTISLGAAWAKPSPSTDWRGVLAAADAALYRAKEGGRNRIEVAP